MGYNGDIRSVINSIDTWCKDKGSMVCMSIYMNEVLHKTEISILKTRSRDNDLLDDEIDEVIYMIVNPKVALRTYKGSQDYVSVTGKMVDMVNEFKTGGFKHIYYNPSTSEYIATLLTGEVLEGLLRVNELSQKLKEVVSLIKCFVGDLSACSRFEILDRSYEGYYCEIRISRFGDYENYLWMRRNISHHKASVGKVPTTTAERKGIFQMINGICATFDDVSKIVIEGSVIKIHLESEPTIYWGNLNEKCDIEDVGVILIEQ